MYEVLKPALSDNATWRIQTFEGFIQFRHVETSVKDCGHSGHPSTGYTDKDTGKGHKIFN
jgi:hypothetical protein